MSHSNKRRRLDGVSQEYITEEETFLVCHDKHFISQDTFLTYLNVLVETPAQGVFSGGVERSVEAKRMCQLHGDYVVACPVIDGDHQCCRAISLLSLSIQCSDEVLDRVLDKVKQFDDRVKRWKMLEDVGGVDCPLCIDPAWDQGIGMGLSHELSEFEDYKNNFENIRQCQTCSSIWCVVCGIEYGQMIHEERNCEMVRRIMSGEDPNIWTIDRTCVKCPQCQVNIEKNGGCNHMTCTQCQRHFCYLCLQDITDGVSGHYERTNCNMFGNQDNGNDSD